MEPISSKTASTSCDVFFLAAEMSGDLHGSGLIKALYSLDKTIKIQAIAGPKMRQTKAKPLGEMEKFQVMGFIDVIKAMPRILYLFWKTKKLILKTKPKVTVLIDYPGFNLKMASSLKKAGFQGKVVQYICPSVWAWKKRRKYTIEKNFHHLFTLFPFEKHLFKELDIDVSYTGHPLVNEVNAFKTKGPAKGSTSPLFSIFPGSRKKEIQRNFRLQIRLAKKHCPKDWKIAVSYASEDILSLIKKICQEESMTPSFISSSEKYSMMARSKFALATSGTITLELALFSIPTFVLYKISPLDTFIARKIFRINLPHYCIVNFTLDKRVFPEFFGPHCREDLIDKSLSEWFSSELQMEECKKDCRDIEKILNRPAPYEEAANQILNLIS